MIYIWTYVSWISSFLRISSPAASSSWCARSPLSSSWFLPSRARSQSKQALRQHRLALARWMSTSAPLLPCARSVLRRKWPWSLSMTYSTPSPTRTCILASPPKTMSRISGSFCSIAPSEAWHTGHLEIPRSHAERSLTPGAGWRV